MITLVLLIGGLISIDVTPASNVSSVASNGLGGSVVVLANGSTYEVTEPPPMVNVKIAQANRPPRPR